MTVELLLEEADALEHANKVLIRDATPEEVADSVGEHFATLVCIIRPQYPEWSRSEVLFDLNRVTEKEYRDSILSRSQQILNEKFDTLWPETQAKAKAGALKEAHCKSNITGKAATHVPTPPEPPPVPTPEPTPAPTPPPAPGPTDLAGKVIRRK